MSETSIVYFAAPGARSHDNTRLAKMARLCDALGLKKIVKKNELAAVKLHFGEDGNDSHIRPAWARVVVEKVLAAGGKPFLTDTTTLYSGSRHNAYEHMLTAYRHGFTPAVVGAPVILADGLYGENDVPVRIKGKHFKEVHIATEIRRAPSMVVLSHFKGHEMGGFGGAIKNLAMGGAAVRGKREQHDTHVQISRKLCIGCGRCVKICPQKALSLQGKKSVVDISKCIGCFECITVCPVTPNKAISIDWATQMEPFVERMTEYAWGVVAGRQKRVCFINFVMNVTPDCDCAGWSDLPMVPDLGILASTDPVALDQACFDLVNQAPWINGADKGKGVDLSKPDKFTARWPHTRGEVQLAHAEWLGMGSRKYELKKI